MAQNNKNLNQNQTNSNQENTTQNKQNKMYLEFCPDDYDEELDSDVECYQYLDITDYVDVPELGWDPEEDEEEEE